MGSGLERGWGRGLERDGAVDWRGDGAVWIGQGIFATDGAVDGAAGGAVDDLIRNSQHK